MKLSATRFLPLAFVVALALLSFWLEQTARVEEAHPSLRRHDPDYIIDRLVINEYDRDGSAVSTLSAAKMVHYPDDDSSELDQPRVIERKRDRPQMEISADRGVTRQAGDEVFLYGNVELVRKATAEVPESRVETSFLHVIRPRSLTRSDKDVAIREEGRALFGRGMEYNNETKELRLLANVRGHFDSGRKRTP